MIIAFLEHKMVKIAKIRQIIRKRVIVSPILFFKTSSKLKIFKAIWQVETILQGDLIKDVRVVELQFFAVSVQHGQLEGLVLELLHGGIEVAFEAGVD